MPIFIKYYYNFIWSESDRHDRIQIFSVLIQAAGVLITLFGIIFILLQLNSSYQANSVQMSSQLYTRETEIGSDEMDDEKSNLSTIWALVPPDVTKEQYAATLLDLATDDQKAISSKNIVELYNNMWGADAFSEDSRKETSYLRKLFMYTQNYFYHIHMALDYNSIGVLDKEEWLTWKAPIAEMHAHPMLLVVIWQGHQNKYFSRKFATFLQKELCSESAPSGVDPVEFKRQKEFTFSFYPQMCGKKWADALPDY